MISQRGRIMGQKFCQSCGSELQPGTKFCASCGATVEQTSKKKIEDKKIGTTSSEKVSEKRATKTQTSSSSWVKWVVIAVALLLLIGGGGYFAYSYFFTSEASEEEQEEVDVVEENFYGYWYSEEDEEGVYIQEDVLTQEVIDEEIAYYEVITSELDSDSLQLEIQSIPEEEQENRSLTLEDDQLVIEDSNGNASEYVAVTEEDYLAFGGTNLQEASENPDIELVDESEEDEEETIGDDEDSEEEFSLTAPDADEETSTSEESSEDEENESDSAEESSGNLSFNDIVGYYLDDTEYGQFVYFINEDFVGSALFNPTSGNFRWTIIELESYTLEDDQFSFEGTSLNDVGAEENPPTLEYYSDTFSFESTSPINMATSGYATEFGFTKLSSVDALDVEIGPENDPNFFFYEMYYYLMDLKN